MNGTINDQKQHRLLIFMLLLGTVLILFFVSLNFTKTVAAYPDGITGYSGQGGSYCIDCHHSGVMPTVDLVGPTTVASGQTISMLLNVVSIAPGTQTHAGFNVSANGGTLAATAAGTQLIGLEIAHTEPKMNAGSGLASFQFDWSAPSHPTQAMTYTLYAAGNSVNFDHNTGGDNANTAALEVVVAPEVASTPALTLTEVITSGAGLVRPTDITNAGDGRIFVVEKAGTIRIFDGTKLLASPFLDISTLVDTVNSDWSEKGLLGLAFHPDYATNGYFYVSYTHLLNGSTLISRIERYEVSGGDANIADPNSGVRVLEFLQDRHNHNGGDLNFGPTDGYLYISLGDGGQQGDPNDYGQDKTQLLGKILRIDVDSTGGAKCDTSGNDNYGIPATNPIDDGAGGDCNEIWSTGLRNPWRFSFDRETADMWIGDVGYQEWEEVNFQPANSLGGENWGWRCYEGNFPRNLIDCEAKETYDFPVFAYDHAAGCSITGGFVYRGTDVPALTGHYIFADYCSTRFWSVSGANHGVSSFGLPDVVGGTLGSVTTFGEDMNGEIYLGENGTNASIYKLTDVDLECVNFTATAVLPIIMNDVDAAVLSWTDSTLNNGGYAIHRSTLPNFMPDATTTHATVPVGSEVYTDTTAIGAVDMNYNYVVQARNCNVSSLANSKEVGEFDFAIEPGS